MKTARYLKVVIEAGNTDDGLCIRDTHEEFNLSAADQIGGELAVAAVIIGRGEAQKAKEVKAEA